MNTRCSVDLTKVDYLWLYKLMQVNAMSGKCHVNVSAGFVPSGVVFLCSSRFYFIKITSHSLFEYKFIQIAYWFSRRMVDIFTENDIFFVN